MSLSVTHCPHCKGRVKLRTNDSRPHEAYGFPTVKRRRTCHKCNFKITTIELPISIGNEIFEEDDE